MAGFSEDVKRRMREEADRVRARLLAERLPMFKAALNYHARGLHPLPIHPDRKVPLVEWKAYQERQPLLPEITSWWTAHPSARVGLITGAAPGIVVVDVDPKHGGSLDGLEIPLGAYHVKTLNGGDHFYFRHPGQPVRNRAGVRPGVDVRGDGGYVVAPPSPGYVRETPWDGHPLPTAPAWVWDTSQRDPSRTGESWFAEHFARATPEGERNGTASRLAGYLLHRGLTPEETTAVLREWASRCLPPFPDVELEQVVTSIASREAGKRKEEGPALRLQAPSALAAREVRFTVDALVPTATLTLLYGRDKIGKTLLSLDMVRAVRTGTPFLNHFAAVEGGVIALLLDDPPGLVRERLVQNLGLSDESLWVATHLDADTDCPMRLLDALAEEARSRRPALIVVDALYVLLEGAEQLHLAGGMRPLMRALDGIAEESGAAVLLIHHPRKSDEEAAGSFVIRASAKSILRLSKPREDRDQDGDAGDTTRRVLRVEGKFLPEAKYALDFHGPGQWTLLGEAGEVRTEELGGRLLAAISQEPGLTAEELAERINRRKGDVARALRQLSQEGRAHKREIPTGGRGRPKQTWWPGNAPGDVGISPPSPGHRARGENPKMADLGNGRDDRPQVRLR